MPTYYIQLTGTNSSANYYQGLLSACTTTFDQTSLNNNWGISMNWSVNGFPVLLLNGQYNVYTTITISSPQTFTLKITTNAIYYSVNNGEYSVLPISGVSFTQLQSLPTIDTFIVEDADTQKPISPATIQASDQKASTKTGANGTGYLALFSTPSYFNVSADGYFSQKITASSATTYNVSLKPLISALPSWSQSLLKYFQNLWSQGPVGIIVVSLIIILSLAVISGLIKTIFLLI